METLSTKKISNKTKKLEVGETIALCLKGYYRIEAVDKMSFAGSEQEVFILGNILEKTIHKTYVPVANAATQGARRLISEKDLKRFESQIESFELNLEPLNNNSNKKMIAYERRVKVGGFWQMIEVYLNVTHDLEVTKRLDKRYVAFQERVRELCCGEISLALEISHEAATDRFDKMIKKVKTQ